MLLLETDRVEDKRGAANRCEPKGNRLPSPCTLSDYSQLNLNFNNLPAFLHLESRTAVKA